MTNKSPVRSAEDVDEQALSYAEIKALATGNPLIIEKCNLEMEVGKLNIIKSSYLSQKYNLEDKILKHYPFDNNINVNMLFDVKWFVTKIYENAYTAVSC